MVSRRSFIRFTAGSAWTLFVGGRALAAIPGGSLSPDAIPKFAAPLVVPPAMPESRPRYYEIAVRQFQQQILPPGLPTTTVWGYGSVNHPSSFNYPAFTIEAQWNRALTIKWINQLVDGQGDYLPHLLPVDPTLHWANPPGGTSGRDMRPTFAATPGPYAGPVPIVTHVHGMSRVTDDSDGYAEAWFLPDAKNIPAGYAREGSWYEFFKRKATRSWGGNWSRGSAIFRYPNTQRASTLWYHDHTLGMTRLNVYAGPAGFYLIRGGPDDALVEARSALPAKLPQGTREIPMAIQDRSFNADGSLFYPSSRAFFDAINGPYLPASDVPPIWNPEFFGNCMVVNGRTWPYLDVLPQRYRFRLLNGCQSRFLVLDFSAIPGVAVWQIGNEGGFLPAPLNLAERGWQSLMAPAERIDLIVDFSGVPPGRYTLLNAGPDEPFGGFPINPGARADAAGTGLLLQFRVDGTAPADLTTPPEFLRLPAIAPLPAAGVTRRVALLEEMSRFFFDAPVAALLGAMVPTAKGFSPQARRWDDPITENPQPGATEVWEIYNFTEDAHPIHIHELVFEVLDRQRFNLANNLPSGNPRPPEPGERGRKDTVIAYPGEITRVRMTFGSGGQYTWHCHIVEHEDNEMMRPYAIGPLQSPT